MRWETVNACRTAFENENAAWYAARYGLLPDCRGDIHRPLTKRAGLQTTFQVKTLPQLIEANPDGKCGNFYRV